MRALRILAVLAAAWAFALSAPARADVGLAIVCSDASVAGKPVVASCPVSSQRYDVPAPALIVRSHPTGGVVAWDDPLKVWKAYGDIPTGGLYEVCATDVPRGFVMGSGSADCTAWTFAAKNTTSGNASVSLSWILPTATVDGAPLTGASALTGVQIFVSTSPIADNSTLAPAMTLGTGATASVYGLTVPDGATVYVRAKAVNAAGAGAFSEQASKTIALPARVPGVPTNLTIVVTLL